jgi:integrase
MPISAKRHAEGLIKPTLKKIVSLPLDKPNIRGGKSPTAYRLLREPLIKEGMKMGEIFIEGAKGPVEAWHEEVGNLLARRYEIAGWSRSIFINDWSLLREVCGPKHPSQVFLPDLEEKVLKGHTQGTRETYVARMRSIFNSMRMLGVIDVLHRPDDGLPKVKVSRATPRPISKDQAVMLMTQASEPMREWFILACLAGLRAMEVATIRGDWLEEHPEGMMLRVHGKGKTEKLIPAHPQIVEIIRKHNVLGRLYTVKPHYLSRLACEEMRRLGIVTKLRSVTAENPSRISFHSCRHFFATAVLAASGNSLVLTSRVLRHQSVNVTMRYADIVNGEEARVVGGLLSDIDWGKVG